MILGTRYKSKLIMHTTTGKPTYMSTTGSYSSGWPCHGCKQNWMPIKKNSILANDARTRTRYYHAASPISSQPNLNCTGPWTSRCATQDCMTLSTRFNPKFQVDVSQDVFDAMETKFAPQDNPVFQLVPPLFHEMAEDYYAAIGRPTVTHATFWEVYQALLSEILQHDDVPDMENIPQSDAHVYDGDAPAVALIPDLQDLDFGEHVAGPGGFYYMGGLQNPNYPDRAYELEAELEAEGMEEEEEEEEEFEYTDEE